MKLPFTIYDLRSTIREESGRAVSPLIAAGAHGVTRPTALNRQSSIVNHKSQSGVALVLTLILLSVALVMTLAFLAISGREQGSVTTQTDTATTRLAADAGLAAAEAQIAANILSTTNPYSFGLIVSRNYAAYQPPFTIQSLTNQWFSPRPPVAVLQNGTNDFRSYLDLNRNGTNDPNGYVVEVDNNNNVIGTNYNAVGDPEWIGVLERPDLPYGPNNPFIARFAFIALPVGNSLDLNAIHNQALTHTKRMDPLNDSYFRNQGVGSWELNLAAFLADLNANEWDAIASGQYQYLQPGFANSGAAFYDAFTLLTNRYAGSYSTLASVQTIFGNNGATAFQFDGIDGYSDGPLQTGIPLPVENDAPGKQWAGADNTNHFFTPEELFDPTKSSGGPTGGFTNRLLNAGTSASTYDRYTFYRMLAQLGTDTAPESGRMNLNYDNITQANPVSGAVSATNFMAWTPLAFFNNAADRMLRAYTAQWDVSYIQTNPAPNVTNLMAVPNPSFVATFNVTAPFGVTSIPVWVSNRFVYAPAVQRVLQLAANLYDASTNSYFPSVFRPLFSRDADNSGVAGMGTNLYVSGYLAVTNVFGPGDAQLSQPVDAMALTTTNLVGITGITGVNMAVNVYGVPWIIGAKKGFPNFNEFVQENAVGITRRLQLTRNTNNATFGKTIPITGTNQMYILNLNSSYGLDFWNSYNSNFFDNVTVVYRGSTLMTITNDDPGFDNHPGIIQPMGFSFANTNSFSVWPGTFPWRPSVQNGGSGQPNANSFYTPPSYTVPVLTNSVYRTGYAVPSQTLPPSGFIGPCLVPVNYFDTLTRPMPVLFETSAPGFPLPHFVLLTTNRLQVFILDGASGNYHVIDYAHFEQNNSRDLNAEIFTDASNGVAAPEGIWATNLDLRTGVPYGIENQISISRGQSTGTGDNGNPPPEDGTWQADAEATLYGTTIPAQQAYFNAFFYGYGKTVSVADAYGNASGSNIAASVQAPYAPTRYGVGYTILQANDPLVHYLASDMALSFPAGLLDLPTQFNNFYTNELTSLNLGSLNYNYQPWSGNPVWSYTGADANAYNLAERDPLVSQSDYWNFPTNKFPTTGWMGRVHRGTPWQTVYLKSPGININNTWAPWSGDKLVANNQFFDAGNSAPVTDRLLFDLFTAAVNDNATRGTLSVNQSADQYDPDGNPADINPAAGLAAWSALFSGMVVAGPTNSYSVIAPVGNQAVSASSLGILVTNINNTRYNFKNADGLVGVFEHEGDILSVPQLTDQSPFLDSTQTGYNSDAMYEWLPQQAMSLLRVGAPRYVIYSYGQALKPAPNGTYLGGGAYFGMVTNYQVMSEMAARAVVRLDTVRTNSFGTDGAIIVTPPRAVIESFNILPPD